ncbi:Fur family transcriptional regulator [Nonomuraea jabiensis]|uniref:Fur family ferric uptake transcriptional regulator n=1 Tax=Nonomuraea jabiensis TaxID=882448 RepID=A0A7W9LF70_9ACTN|nr:Fur family transcriptional regulator [Nonomuraea jabiensis]MBB5781601.1 Fur family ferric uptake transcriptional regulator [Nonomuraea jabiensis]
MTPSSTATALLKNVGLSPTRQRRVVVERLIGLERPVSAQALHEELQANGARLGLTTVYRTLNALAENGLAHVFEDHGETTYRLCGPNHHHHLVCQSCGTVIEGPPVPELGRWLRRLGTEHGFQAERHHFEVYGTCGTCRLAGEPGTIAPPTQ